ncbi:hypothetical protein BJ165DRAFT_1394853 [Panaeolus papilionaceus]|nr:hypothetical protein BJ165DRAFT_1394853 [Panaeolus papilionaceus]
MLNHSIENPREIEEYVKTEEFDEFCLWESEARKAARSIAPNEESHDSDEECVQSNGSKFEARYYYAGVGPKYQWPTLIYRTSEDVYRMRFLPPPLKNALVVSETHEFAQDGLWDRVRNKVVELLDMRNIRFTSVDFVRFRSRATSMGYPEVISNPTIWIGIVPNTLNAAGARESASDIRAYLDELKVQNIDIAYRESIAKFLSSHGPPLLYPVKHDHPLKSMIDPFCVALGIPVSGRNISTQGTLGPYFQAGDKLYAITTRHNLFPLYEGNAEYRHSDSSLKRDVFVMSDCIFKSYLESIRIHIVRRIWDSRRGQQRVDEYKTKVQTGVDLPKSRFTLEEAEANLVKSRAQLNRVKEFYADIVKNWSSRKNRTIGFVTWSPPLGLGAAPHCFTRDLCVVELYEDKFRNMMGNFLMATWPVINVHTFPGREDSLVGNWVGGVIALPSYGLDGLVALGGILTMDQLNDPTTIKRFIFDYVHKDSDESEHPPRRVVKRGSKSNTTFGTLSRYMSHVRKYTLLGDHMDSIELPILNFEGRRDSEFCHPFCEEGNSGSAVVTSKGEFVGLLNGGTSMGFRECDIGYATPFEWVWEQVSKEFPGANLDFDNPELEPPCPEWLLRLGWTSYDSGQL